jgi:hypothetical protein
MNLVERRSAIMANHHDFNHQVWQTMIITVALGACFVFGIIVLVSGDWLPGETIVSASTVGLARQVPVIRNLCSTGYGASPPKHKSV